MCLSDKPDRLYIYIYIYYYMIMCLSDKPDRLCVYMYVCMCVCVCVCVCVIFHDYGSQRQAGPLLPDTGYIGRDRRQNCCHLQVSVKSINKSIMEQRNQ